jgi:non-ribosomal peptide synthase protein (TIGR01720 family)
LRRQHSHDLGVALVAFREQLRRIPSIGRGYALLERFGGDLVRELPKVVYDFDIRFDLVFNYLGQIDQLDTEQTLFRPARESVKAGQSPQDLFWCLVECKAVVVGGRLVVRWDYSSNVYRRITIEQVAASFLELLEDLVHLKSSGPNM